MRERSKEEKEDRRKEEKEEEKKKERAWGGWSVAWRLEGVVDGLGRPAARVAGNE